MDTGDSQRQKRPRLEEEQERNDSSAGDARLSRHPKLWFEDGNVILQVEQTQFKVHSSILCAQSPIFKDMFSVPQPVPSSSSGHAEDCPIVILHDCTVDVENALSLLYDSMSIYNRRKKISPSVIGSMLRMGRKYHFQHFIAEALHCLNLEFPPTIDILEFPAAKNTGYIERTEIFLFDVVYLAHEFSVKSILPGIYWKICANYSFDQIRAGFNRPQFRHVLKTDEPLSCLAGRERLYQAAISKGFRWVTDDTVPVQNCPQAKACATWISNFTKYFRKNEPSVAIGFLASSCWINIDKYLCASCRVATKAAFDSGRQQIWNELSDIFELSNKELDTSWHTESLESAI